MTHSVKRGLGLLVLGLPLLLIAGLMVWLLAPLGAASALATLTAGLLGAGCTLIGLGLIATSLLRD